MNFLKGFRSKIDPTKKLVEVFKKMEADLLVLVQAVKEEKYGQDEVKLLDLQIERFNRLKIMFIPLQPLGGKQMVSICREKVVLLEDIKFDLENGKFSSEQVKQLEELSFQIRKGDI